MKWTFHSGLTLTVIFFLTVSLHSKTPYEEVDVDGHRCLVVRPENLPPSAPLVLILHGYGTNGDELFDLCKELGLPPCLYILPDGPFRAYNLPPVDHGWYDTFTHSRQDMEDSRDYLFEVMDRFSKVSDSTAPADSPLKPRPIIIMGFSQGAIMSLEAGLNYKGNIAAIISMMGFIEYPKKTLAHPAAPPDTPILLIHGEWDPVIQEDDTQATVKALKKAGYHPLLRELPMGHHVTRNVIDEVSSFLQNVLPQNR